MSVGVRAPALLVLVVLCVDACFAAAVPRGYDPGLTEEVVLPKKRPFCNAFTGCGRKRSQGAPGMPPAQDLLRQRQFLDDESIGSILDTETAIDDLSRQILSEAKLWEAIQEASAELARRKQKDMIYAN